ncbi:uncharacterized protein LOC142234101 [Haematobia irritans]|uniref:uncharacterized protein LOC142234101 n=1 Tax=Haematobia irritans TaxID=7368 RepID=UPI003F502B22
MDENLIEEVKKHKVIYFKKCLEYKNKIKRAEAWDAISKSIGVPESDCQTRWRSLRDRYVKEYNKIHRASGSGYDGNDSQWPLFKNMEFLREQVAPRKTISNIARQQHSQVHEIDIGVNMEYLNSEESFIDSNEADTPCTFDYIDYDSQEAIPYQNQKTSDNEAKANGNRMRKRTSNSNELGDFLNKISTIAEKRFCSNAEEVPPTDNKHKGFFLMVQDLFKKLPEEEVDDSKIYFINYLHDKIKHGHFL